MDDLIYTNNKSVWNFDQVELMQLFELKDAAITLFSTKNLEGLYWVLRAIWRELDAKMEDEEQITFSASMGVLDMKRKYYLRSEINETDFYLFLESFYMDLCRMMKKHGLYYREKENDQGL